MPRAPHQIGFDWVDPTKRGKFARLTNGEGSEVRLTEYPATLLAMLKMNVLTGQAKKDAERVRRELDDKPIYL